MKEKDEQVAGLKGRRRNDDGGVLFTCLQVVFGVDRVRGRGGVGEGNGGEEGRGPGYWHGYRGGVGGCRVDGYVVWGEDGGVSVQVCLHIDR